MANWPASLKPIKKYMARAHEVEKVDPIVSYYCRFYSLQRAIELRDNSDEHATQFVTGLLEKCEALKQSIDTDMEMHKAHVHDFAMSIFDRADQEDRADRATRETALTFYTAMCFMEVCNVFGEVTPDMQEKLRYSKWKAADITKALREGRRPTPGAPGEAEAEAAALDAGDEQPLPSNSGDRYGNQESQPVSSSREHNNPNADDSKRSQESFPYPTVAPAYPSSDQPSPLQERTVLSSAGDSLYPEADGNDTPRKAPPRMPTLPMLQIPGQPLPEDLRGPSVSAVMPTPQANGGHDAPRVDYNVGPTDKPIELNNPNENIRGIQPPTDKPLGMNGPTDGPLSIHDYDPRASIQPPTDHPLHQHPPSYVQPPTDAPLTGPSSYIPANSKPAGYPRTQQVQLPPPAQPPNITPTHDGMSGMMPPRPYNPNFEPSVKQTQEAQRLAKYAASALDFQDHRTAISNLEEALALLRGSQ